MCLPIAVAVSFRRGSHDGRSCRRRHSVTGGSNPWHDVKVEEPIDEWFWAFIEIPKGSKVKYELDKETGLLKVDRVLFRGALSRELRLHPAVVLRRR